MYPGLISRSIIDAKNDMPRTGALVFSLPRRANSNKNQNLQLW